MKIDVCTTAMPRPEVLDRTYKSFLAYTHNVEWGDCYINIDPLPGKEGIDWPERQAVIDVAKKYFVNVVSRCPETPSYSDAFNFVWSHAQSDLILNLEDDWMLIRPLDMNIIRKYFIMNPSLYQVILRAYTYKYPCMVTSPSFISRDFYSCVGGKLSPHDNPEWQIHHRQDMGIFIPNKRNCNTLSSYFQVYPFIEKSNTHIIVKDIGREWMDKTKYVRPQTLDETDRRYTKKKGFVQWLVK